ncbi:hypothetical protein JQ614_30075 [Bradyrhizobium diazoefficiens]|uniref:Kelch repeat-containing protein n=1 Tax=Bradyrhizobium diazoefficiens TaxID=1355477 RepID=UPI001B8AECA6|nr:hypothetical protein [Bradyrhizobium diazoefficiens]MBR0865903.1 hypothetical protein [Bradyrhizobium diazoefficiens]MBR0922203.1 hypothetical protein [Bradyrhizobium diazoefficiens]
MVRTCKMIGRLPRVLGDMPGVSHNGVLLVLGGGSGMETRDEILAVEPSGGVTEVGRLERPCRGHQAVKIGEALYVLGGFAEKTLHQAYRMDLSNFRTESIAPLPRDTAWFTATEWEGMVCVLGGFSIPGGYWKEIALYDPAKDQWTSSEDVFPGHIFPKRSLGSNAAVAANGRIISFGGADTFNRDIMRSNALDICAMYDPRAGAWERVPVAIDAREGLVPVKSDDHVFLVGGMKNHPENASDLIEVVDTKKLTVAHFAHLLEGRVAAACGLVGKHLIVAGGVTEGVASMTDTIEAVEVD